MAENNHPSNYFGLNAKKRAYGYQGAPIVGGHIKPNQTKTNTNNTTNNRSRRTIGSSEPVQKNYPPQALATCIHNRGKTGNKVGTGCRQEFEYSCELFGHCILNACSYSGTRRICAKCSEFKHVNSEQAREYLEMLNQLGKAEEPIQQEVSIEDIIDAQDSQIEETEIKLEEPENE